MEAMLGPKPSILFIDAYDSFTNNIISLLITTLACTVRVVHIDTDVFKSDDELREELRGYDAVVCGPGPGNPGNPEDVGIMTRIWRLADEDLVPVLGICLGFQSLGLEFGAKVRRLDCGLHGMIRRVKFRGEGEENIERDIFDGAGEIFATLYQSLCVDIGQDNIPLCRWQEQRWAPTKFLQPLAWVEQNDVNGSDSRILVAMRHRTKPFWALQYHPESICTNGESKKVVMNWFVASQKWNRETKRNICRDRSQKKGELPVRMSLLAQVQAHAGNQNCTGLLNSHLDCSLEYRTLDLPDHVSIIDIVETLQCQEKEQIILESSNSKIEGVGAAKVRGRYSIIGLNVDDALKIQYKNGDDFAILSTPTSSDISTSTTLRVDLDMYGSIWPLLAEFVEKRRIRVGNLESPFWGGFMGYTSYELGLPGIGIKGSTHTKWRSFDHLDLCFAWVTRSIVVDHLKQKIYVQYLTEKAAEGSQTWFDQVTQSLACLSKSPRKRRFSNGLPKHIDLLDEFISKKLFQISLPDSTEYESKVSDCQEYICKGDAYEICLTDQTHIALPYLKFDETLLSTAWSLYRKLRSRQPAPYASFIRLGAATFLSASPERFLQWDANGRCELRPMKGTVKKTCVVNTLAQAESLLKIPKEQAENLMIVDLVRHDLHSVCGAGNVNVPKLMVVEEYTSVFQMISAVQGHIPIIDTDGFSIEEAERAKSTRHTGIDVLAASLPPGSMTGAPKKRACEILQSVEGGTDRGLYSGVVGYMDVGGRGDFSVNIRCLYKWDDEIICRDGRRHTKSTASEPKYEVWTAGAGGAVTTLSSPVGEREEMETKLSGTLGLFTPRS